MDQELRRTQRIAVCCRVAVRDRYGIWSAVTEDVNARGCRIVTQRLLRAGSALKLTLSSDLFPRDLEVAGKVVWATGDRLAISFIASAPRKGRLSPEEWIAKVVEVGANEARKAVVPVVRSRGRAVASLRLADPDAPRETKSRPSSAKAESAALPLPTAR